MENKMVRDGREEGWRRVGSLDLERWRLKKKIRFWVIFFVVALALSGVTAFWLETEMSFLVKVWPFSRSGSLYGWIELVYMALRESGERYPFLAYGYDWLAF